LGQENPIGVVSLFAADTIEDRILRRLYDRILLAVDTLGDIDPILGDRIDALARQGLSGVLSPDDQERQAEDTVLGIVREEGTARRLSQEADGFLAADQAFLDEIGNLVGQRRIPVGTELRQYLEEFLAKRYPGSSVPARLGDGAGLLSLPVEVGTEMR